MAEDAESFEEEIEEEIAAESGYEALLAVLGAIGDTSSGIISFGLRKALQEEGIKRNLKNGVMPYLYAAGFLSYVGREIDKQTITATLRAMNIEPKQNLMEEVIKLGLKSHLVYVYAYYLLMALGKEASVESISRIAAIAGGVEPDKAVILESLAFIKGMDAKRQ